jgi:hypothetical protein
MTAAAITAFADRRAGLFIRCGTAWKTRGATL